jgi:hypothetical protein
MKSSDIISDAIYAVMAPYLAGIELTIRLHVVLPDLSPASLPGSFRPNMAVRSMLVDHSAEGNMATS